MNNNNLLNEGYQQKKVFFDRANGPYIYHKKSKYLDLSCCAGTLLLGHNSKVFQKSLDKIKKNQISNTASLNQQAVVFSKNLKKKIQNYSKFIMCNSGTEAVTKALRICRAVTKKKLIISVGGSWHGSADETLYVKKNRENIPLSDGLNSSKTNIIFVPYNDIQQTKKILDKYKKKIMCILIEPIQAGLPVENAKNYLKFLYNYSFKNNLILFFDEMITGLRTDGKTLQNFYNIKPDISTFGKSYGGGMPIGFIGISRNIENKIKNNKTKIYFGGTFSANAISMYIANETLNFIQKNKKKIFNKINRFAGIFQKELNLFFIKNSLDMQILKFKSISRIVFSKSQIQNRYQRDFLESKKNKKISLFTKFLFKKKIYYPGNGIIFFNYAMSKKDLNNLIESIKSVSQRVFYEN
jgi:glutamate-1-semialdehyde 2,1-aminomutase